MILWLWHVLINGSGTYQQSMFEFLSSQCVTLVFVKSMEDVGYSEVGSSHTVEQDKYRLFTINHCRPVYYLAYIILAKKE